MASSDVVDFYAMKRIRMRIDTDDPIYRGLKKLKCRGKDLGHLPNEIFHLMELEVLDLSPERQACLFYKLQEVPPAIGKLVNLRVLMLDTNELGVIPKEICLLTHLEKMSLSNNYLSALPDGFSSLTRLESLHMANNRFEKFPLPILALKGLKFVDLSDNQLLDLPDGISKLQDLESLLLYMNSLTKLPDSICDMGNLRVLWIGNNNLKRLPRKFGRLKNLDWGYRHTISCAVDGNPLQLPPVEVCKQGTDAIESYLDVAEPKRK